MVTTIHIFLISTVVCLLLAFGSEVLLRTKCKTYNERRKNPMRAYFAIGTPDTEFMHLFTSIRNKLLVASVALFVITGIIGIINSL